MFRRETCERACNWKLVIEAFLDGYHIRVLHRATIYRFFLDAMVAAEPAGPHIRAMTARKRLADADAPPHERGTPSYLVFPATVIIEHPDFVSIITVHPLAPNRTRWSHAMLVPRERATETDHWTKSWELIEGGVFQREDLWICEQAQQAIDDGGCDELVFGALESPARWFHDALDAALRTG